MFIKVSFKSAKLPISKSYMSKDGVLKIGGAQDDVFRQYTNEVMPRGDNRIVTDTDAFGNPFGSPELPIHKEQISNVLHVLLGERPVSFFNSVGIDGKPIRKRIAEIDEVVKKCFIKFDNVFKYTNKEGKTVFITETVMSKKSRPSNSKAKMSVSWRHLYMRFINRDGDYEKYIDILNTYSGKKDVTKEYCSLEECLKNMSPSNLSGMKDFLKKQKGLVDITEPVFLRPDVKGKYKGKYGTITVNSTPKKFISVDGSIIYNVDNDMYQRIIKGTKFATILDGGLASLERWDDYGIHKYGLYDNEVSEYDLLEEGYKKITDIDGEEYRTPENYFKTSSTNN